MYLVSVCIGVIAVAGQVQVHILDLVVMLAAHLFDLLKISRLLNDLDYFRVLPVLIKRLPDCRFRVQLVIFENSSCFIEHSFVIRGLAGHFFRKFVGNMPGTCACARACRCNWFDGDKVHLDVGLFVKLVFEFGAEHVKLATFHKVEKVQPGTEEPNKFVQEAFVLIFIPLMQI